MAAAAVAVVGILLLAKAVGWFADTFFLTAVARYGTLEVSAAGEGVVLRRERPVPAPVSGRVIFLVQDGQRVARGTPIAEIIDEQQKRALRMRLRVIESQIKQFERERNLWGLVLGGKKEGSKDAKAQKKQLALAKEREQLIQLLGGGGRLLVAEESGLVSFYTDDLEEKLNPENATSLLSFDKPFSRLRSTLGGKSHQMKDREVIREGNAVFKIVDNFRFWILADLPDAPVAFTERAQVKVRFHGGQAMHQARVERIFVNPSMRRQRLLLSLDRQIEGLDRLRWLKLEVISMNREGVIVPRSAVVERNGQAGVYLKVGGFSFFRAVGILGEAQNRLVVWGIPEGVRVVVHPR
ncbi:MAG: HlyD family efflux transporter periplasmic adaptor subunit [Syntrophothermus sp.]